MHEHREQFGELYEAFRQSAKSPNDVLPPQVFFREGFDEGKGQTQEYSTRAALAQILHYLKEKNWPGKNGMTVEILETTIDNEKNELKLLEFGISFLDKTLSW